MLYTLLRKDKFATANRETKKELIKKYIDNQKERNLIKIIEIAKRITRKQLESLSDVEKRIRFTIDLTKTCDDIAPNRLLAGIECPKKRSEKEPIELFLNDNDKASKRSRRTFKISSNRSYKRWNQVRIKVLTNKLEKEIAADPDGPKPDKKSEFWVGFFDFPLVDNTFISNKERYAVILDSINETEAKVSLLYFPASYAGFKEKSYYQHRIINTLLKDSSLSK